MLRQFGRIFVQQFLTKCIQCAKLTHWLIPFTRVLTSNSGPTLASSSFARGPTATPTNTDGAASVVIVELLHSLQVYANLPPVFSRLIGSLYFDAYNMPVPQRQWTQCRHRSHSKACCFAAGMLTRPGVSRPKASRPRPEVSRPRPRPRPEIKAKVEFNSYGL